MSTQPTERDQHVKAKIAQHWHRRAPDFDKQASHGLLNDAQHDAWLALVKETVGPRPLDTLDVGCGTGFLTLLLAELGHRSMGLDMAEAMIDEARAKAVVKGIAATFIGGDAEAPPADIGPVDLICMRHVIWTLPDPEAAARRWLALLRPGGRVLLVEGEFKNAGINDEYLEIGDSLPLIGGRPAGEITALLERAGFAQPVARPLMDEALWLEAPAFPRYMVVARRATP